MSHTPPVDSKGAAIRQALKELPILKNYMITPDRKTLPTNYNLNDEDVEAILAILAQEVNITKDRWKSDILSGFKPICSYCGIKSRKVVGQTTKGEHAQQDNHLPRNWGYYCQRCHNEGMEMEREAMYG